MVVLTEVLEHLPDAILALREIRRVLKPDGMLVFTVPLTYGEHDWIDFHRWTEQGLRQILDETGFSVGALERKGGIFRTIAAFIDQVPYELLVDEPVGFEAMRGSARIRLALSVAIQMLLTPLVWSIAAMDRIDRHRRFTLGFIGIASPRPER